MWKCPKCGREFKNNNQSHYCKDKPTTIEEYILLQDSNKQDDLRTLWSLIKKAIPDVDEKISWSMPSFYKGVNIINFAASKNHIGLYPGISAVQHFEEALMCYKTNKGTIQIPYGNIDKELVTNIAVWCYENRNKE